MGNVSFLTGIRYKEQPISRADIFDAGYWTAKLGLLPGYSGYLKSQFIVYGGD
jgi:hypothetical protein